MNKPVDTHLALADARRLTQRVHFERDGTVTIASGKVDLGQGISTALAQIAAEELGVELSKVRILPASTAYSPDEGVTSGSLSIQDGGKGLRKACAELRDLLKRSGKRTYWELEVAGDIPAQAPEKPPAEYRIVGKSVPRVELPAKIAGKPSYLHDIVLPGMLHARILRPPRPYAKLVSLPPAPARGEDRRAPCRRRRLLRPQRRGRRGAGRRTDGAHGERKVGAPAMVARGRIRVGAVWSGDGAGARGAARCARQHRLLAPRSL